MFRFSRVASVALFVALSFVAVLAQGNDPLSSKPHKFDHKLKITTQYNEPSDATAVRLQLKQPNSLARLAGGGGFSADPRFGDDVAIAVFFSHPGRQPSRPVDEATMWVVYTGGPRTSVTSELRAMVDGRELMLGQEVHAEASPDRRQGNRVGSLSLPVTRDHLMQIANASEAVLVLPSGERITLTRGQLNALADFSSRMAPR